MNFLGREKCPGIKKHVPIALIVIFIVGAILRFKGLTFQSHWLDELFSARMSNPENSFFTMYDGVVGDVHPPLYQIILWLWYHVFGFTEYVGRSLSAIFGSLFILVIYVLGKEFYNKETGLYAAAIASLNSYLIYYSQEVRSYSLLVLLSSVSYLYFLRVLKTGSTPSFILYLVTTVALLYTHYYGIFLVATQVFVFAYYFMIEKEQRKNLIVLAVISTLVFAVSLIPLVQPLMNQESTTSFWIKPPSNGFFLEYMKAYVNSQYLEGVFLSLLLFVIFCLFINKDNNSNRGNIQFSIQNNKGMFVILVLWIVVGYLLPYVRSVTAVPLLTLRNTIIVIPAFIILISYGVFLLRLPALKAAAIGAIIVLSIHQLDNVSFYNKVTKDQYREILFDVDQSKTTYPVYTIANSYKTYIDLLKIELTLISKEQLRLDFEKNSLPECFWIIDAHGNHVPKHELLNSGTIKKVIKIKKFQAKAILYSYNTTPKRCSYELGGDVIGGHPNGSYFKLAAYSELYRSGSLRFI